MLRAVVLVSLAGCGRLGFSDHAPPDGTVTDTRAGDANADASGDAMADARPDAAMLGPCTPLALTDNFDDGTRAAAWTLLANNPVQVAETGGQLQVTLSTSGGAHYGGYDSTATYDLRDHCMYVTYVTTPTAEPAVEMQFGGRTAVGTVGFVVHDGSIDPFVNAGAFVSLGTFTYDPVNDKVLRVRDDAGMMSWETSADGTTFNVVASQPDPIDVSAVTVILEAGTYMSEPSPGIARYDNFDLP